MLLLFLIDIMVAMGFARDEIHDSVVNQKYDEVMATYLLLGRKPPEVIYHCFFNFGIVYTSNLIC